MSGKQLDEDALRQQMKRLVYLFSHDMRNPLVNMKALIGELHVSLQEAVQGDQALLQTDIPDALQMLEKSVERMDLMIQGANALYHGFFDSLEYEKVELQELVERVVHRFDSHQGVVFQVDSLPTVWADPLAVARIVEELLRNSLQAMAEQGGTISVAAKEDADAVVLEVTDSGRGVNSEEQTKLFEPFYSGFGSRPGVGLTLVKAMVEAHGGSIHCESQADHGATFHVVFPQQGTYQ